MNDLYKDKTHISNLLKTLAENINELEMVSINNEDILSFELSDLKTAFNESRIKLGMIERFKV